MRAIFISYRREDSEGEAGRLFDDLVRQFGEASVVMDVANFEVGRDFRKAIDQSVATCGVLLAVMGKDWFNSTNEAGKPRLDDPSDFVRLETASALKRDIPVIPVLTRGARMPHADQLPEDIKELAYRNGVELTHARWGSDLQLLINALRSHVEQPSPIPVPRPYYWWKSRWAMLAFALTALTAVAIVVYVLRRPTGIVPDSRTSAIQRAPASDGSRLTPGNTFPNFAGTWELINNTMNGVPQNTQQRGPLTITQNGGMVRIGNQDLQVTSGGTITYKSFAAHDANYGHSVQTEGEADLVDTLSWKVDGSTLVFETIFDYRAPYFNHPVGRDVRIMKYRRISP